MNANVLINALIYYTNSAECQGTERDEVFKGLKECYQVIGRYRDGEECKYAVNFINSYMLMDLLNMTTYDVYGRCQRMYRTANFYDYAYRCRHDADLYGLTDDQLLIAYDFIRDLWSDNERDGCNNPDGTFNKR